MDMREKMARALAAQQMRPWEASGRIYKEDCLAMADAALAALMEPTEAMLRAGCEHLSIQGTWRSMIRAAGE